MKKPKAILFDWDNTLADTWPIIHASLNKTFTHMGHDPWSADDVKSGREGIHHSLRDSFPRIFGDRWEEAKEVYFKSFLDSHLTKITMLPGADTTVKLLAQSDIYLAIVSNKTGEYLREEVKHLGWIECFSKIVGASDAAADKPAPDPIHLALKGSGLTVGQNIWMIGDSETDLDCAINANCTPMFFGDGTMHERFLDQHRNIPHFRTHSELHEIIRTFI